jgi:signal transduction histidine kinase/AmiR/NasT family two-component response regulator
MGVKMFASLRTKLTVLYGGLFAAIFVLISLAVYVAIAGDAEKSVGRELTTSGAVFERVWALRTAQLQNGAGLLSRDYGFREAIATNDAATIRSALSNLQVRLGMDMALMIGVDGTVTGAGDSSLARLTPRVFEAMETDDAASGVVTLGDMPYQVVSVPVTAPVTMGWVVFATKLDQGQMRALRALAAVPLQASIVRAGPDGRWPGPEGAFIARALKSGDRSAHRLAEPGGGALAVVKRLRSLDPKEQIVLLLQYPMARAMAPYRVLMGILLVLAALGLAALLAGTWALARSVTRPISALEDAARRMQAGEQARVEVNSRDELGRLAVSFNRMVEEIGQREAERTRAAAVLERARDAAEAANRAKSSFLANMSHEVRTPLNGVLGVAGVLAGSPLDDEQRHMVGIIQDSALTLKGVLNDVLDLALAEAGGMEIALAAFDVGEIARNVAAAAEVRCRAKGLEFAMTLDPACGPVTGDRARLEQILSALLDNAVKFTDAGEVTLAIARTASGAGSLRFEVADTGVGFDPALSESLFQPFHQADGSDTRRFGGSGLGLSIARELARAMGGEIVAAGGPGEGATFTLSLDLPPALASPPAPASAADAEPSDRPLRVLLADDHETNRTVARLILTAAGAELTLVEDGAKAVRAFEQGSFDIVLMDIQMPVMDGLTAIRRIREQEARTGAARTPILVVSANALPEHVQGASAAGADGHIAKPVTPPSLIAAVDQALTAAAELQALRVA